MLDDQFDILTVPAARAREHVVELEAERRLAEATGVATIASYIEDLDWELEAWRRVYVTSAVTEIAVLRAELDGRLTDG
jgi:hypothetical protein